MGEKIDLQEEKLSRSERRRKAKLAKKARKRAKKAYRIDGKFVSKEAYEAHQKAQKNAPKRGPDGKFISAEQEKSWNDLKDRIVSRYENVMAYLAEKSPRAHRFALWLREHYEYAAYPAVCLLGTKLGILGALAAGAFLIYHLYRGFREQLVSYFVKNETPEEFVEKHGSSLIEKGVRAASAIGLVLLLPTTGGLGAIMLGLILAAIKRPFGFLGSLRQKVFYVAIVASAFAAVTFMVAPSVVTAVVGLSAMALTWATAEGGRECALAWVGLVSPVLAAGILAVSKLFENLSEMEISEEDVEAALAAADGPVAATA